VIALTEATDATPTDGQCLFVELGTVNQGKTYFYNAGTTSWTVGQTKTALNQPPLFDMFDNSSHSFSNTTVYPNSSFTGAKVFEYKTSDTAVQTQCWGSKSNTKPSTMWETLCLLQIFPLAHSHTRVVTTLSVRDTDQDTYIIPLA
jgi:hypothetical protein